MKPVLALDCGAATLKVALFEPQPNGALVLSKYELFPLGQRGLEEADRTGLLKEVLQDLLDREEMRVKGVDAHVCTPSYQCFTKFLTAPGVDGKKVGQIITYEAQQNVPFPLDEVEWGYQVMGTTEDGDLDVMLMALKLDVIEGLSTVCTDIGVKLSIVDGAPAALRNAFMHNYGELEGCTMLLDIGAKTSNVIFLEDGNFFSRSINFGANSITQEFAREANLDFEQAEEYKKNYGYVHLTNIAEPEDAYQAILVRAARQVMTRLHQQLEQTRQYYVTQRKGQTPLRMFLAGAGCSMIYTAEFFIEKFGLEVTFFNPFRNIEVGPEIDSADLAKKAHAMGELAGLGLRATSVGLTEFNLLPQRDKISRQIEKRTPYAIAVVFCAGLLPFVNYAFFNKQKAEQEKASETLTQKLESYSSTVKGMQDSNNVLENRRTSAVQMEELLRTRFIWIDLSKALQNVFTEVTGKGVFIVTKPNQLLAATNTAAQVQANLAAEGTPPGGLTNAITEIWIESLTTTPPATVGGAGGMDGGGMGGMGGMGGFQAGPGASGFQSGPGSGEGMAGPGGSSSGGSAAASSETAEDVEYLYLELKAKNILPREREDLNKEFAELLASRFRANPLFSDSEEETKITSNIPPGKPEDRWFSFKMQVKLVTPIQMQPPDDGY